MKKKLLSLGVFAMSAAPLAALISCGSTGFEGRYDSENDGKLVIQTGFSATGNQRKGLDNLVAAYNATKPEMEVEIVGIEGGYSAITPTLSTNFEAGDKKKTPNLIVAYPDSLGSLAKYNMQEEIAKDEDIDKIKALFDEDFISVNDQIGGVEAGKVYSLPFAKSINMSSVNTPVMKHIVTELNKISGLKINFPTGWTHTTDATGPEITKLWGVADTTKATNIAKLKQFNNIGLEEIFKDGEKLLTFVANAMPLFKTARANKLNILGLDNATNFVYQSVFQRVGGKFEDFLFTKGDDGYISYGNWSNEKSKARVAIKNVYDKLKEAINVGGVYINSGGAYSSGLETQHKIGIAIGSTAGYNYNYIKGSSSTPFVTINGKNEALTSHTDAFTEDTTDAQIIGKFSSYNNKIYKSTFPAANIGSHDKQSKDAQTDKDIEALITKAGSNKNKLFISSNDLVEDMPKTKKVQIDGGPRPKYLILADGVNSASAVLQKEELEIISSPQKFGGGSIKVQLVQGPSLIGVHVNNEEDAEMKKFINWVMSAQSTTFESDTFAHPYEIFSSTAGYVVPTKDSLAGAKPSGMNAAEELTFDTLKAIDTDANFYGFDNPVDDTTGKFRAVLNETIALQATQSTALTFEEIYKKVNRSR